MQMITWVILPVLCVIAVAVYLYRKVKAAVKCFLPAYSFKRQRIFAGIISLLLIIPAVRIYGIWFIILLHFTVAGYSCFSYKKIEKAKSAYWFME